MLSKTMLSATQALFTLGCLTHFAFTTPIEPPTPSIESLYLYRDPLAEFLPRENLKDLVIVACHGIWKGGPNLGESDDEWILEPYQKSWNETLTWIQHIEFGAQVIKDLGGSGVLMFSGGETRPHGGTRFESLSYYNLADARGIITPDLAEVTTTENYARDSYENVLFSICRFKEFTGNYPRTITIVGYEFKAKRFGTIHRQALRFPEESFKYIGLNSIHSPEEKIAEMASFELSHSLKPFERDPYACFEPVLIEKKNGRNPGRRVSSYERSCPEMKGLINWCGLDKSSGEVSYYPGKLPWTDI